MSNLKASDITAHLTTLSGPELVAIFNGMCKDGSEVKRFASKTVAVKRILNTFGEAMVTGWLNEQAALSLLGITSDTGGESDEQPALTKESKPKRTRRALDDNGLVQVIDSNPRHTCMREMVAIIEGYTEEHDEHPTVAYVLGTIDKSGWTPPRSQRFRKGGKARTNFFRLYFCGAVREDALKVVTQSNEE